MLQQHCDEDIQTQYDSFSKIVDEWKKGREQFDDQTLIGIRI